MRPDLLKGPDLTRLLAQARALRGDDVVVLSTRRVRAGASLVYELAIGDAAEVERFRAALEPGPLLAAPAPAAGTARRPRILALVGPTGAGKTTTAAKLALHPRAFGGARVALLTLDTYRVAALEQIQTYADIAGLPLEVVYEPAEVVGALGRLSGRDVVIVDTPGRSPRRTEADEWPALLRALGPDEVHLVLPAGVRGDVAAACAESFRGCRPTHLLLTKLDEVPGETGIAELAADLGLPARWVTDGQDVPADLRVASPRILASLGSIAGSAA